MGGKLAHKGGLFLLQPADDLHLVVGVMCVEAVPRAARAVGHGDAGEIFVVLSEAFEDAVIGHDLNVVLMRRHREVRGAGERSSSAGVPSGTYDFSWLLEL